MAMADWGIALVNAGGDEEGGQPILIYADIREMPHLCWSQICRSQIYARVRFIASTNLQWD